MWFDLLQNYISIGKTFLNAFSLKNYLATKIVFKSLILSNNQE